MSSEYLLELKTYFQNNATFRRMNTIATRTRKCVMCLSSRRQAPGYVAWFLLRWNVLSESQQYDFRYFVGHHVLRLPTPSMFCVGVRHGAKLAVVFYIHDLLQDLVNNFTCFNRYRAQDRLLESLNVLHDPQHTDWLFLNHAYDV
jgi:hypothetical protein